MTTDYILSLVTPFEIYMMLRGFIPAVIIVIIGMFIGRWDSAKHFLTFNKLTHYIFLPCLAFSAIHRHAFEVKEIFSIALAISIAIFVMSVISAFIFHEKLWVCSKNRLATVYMSSGTLLLPMAFVLFGNDGLAKAIYFHFFVKLAYHTLGLWMLEGKSDLKGFLKTPFIYLVLIGVLTRLFPFSTPEIIEEFAWLAEKGIDLTAMGALPLLFISFGYPLGLLKWSDARIGLKGGLLRVIAGPLVALLVVYIYRKTGFISMERGYDVLGYLDLRTTEAILVLGAAMPTSNYAMMIGGNEVNGEKAEMGTLLVSAVASIITIPTLLLLILMFIF